MFVLGGHAVGAQGTIPEKELVVATKEAPPFAMKQPDGNWGGISIELWETDRRSGATEVSPG
jgi:polar amino acid transport system substrate-binding protein